MPRSPSGREGGPTLHRCSSTGGRLYGALAEWADVRDTGSEVVQSRDIGRFSEAESLRLRVVMIGGRRGMIAPIRDDQIGRLSGPRILSRYWRNVRTHGFVLEQTSEGDLRTLHVPVDCAGRPRRPGLATAACRRS